MQKSSYELVNLQQYSYFDSREEMDFVVKQFNKELSKSYYRTLNMLKQYSCKIVGICHLKIKTIANTLEIHERTVRRHIKYLKENGFITIIPTSRPTKGGDGANAYAINSPLMREEVKKNKNVSAELSPRQDAQTSTAPMFDRVLLKRETINSLKLYNSFKVTKESSYESQNRIENIKNYRECPEGVPEHIYLANKPFFTDGQISKLYESILDKLVSYKFNQSYDNLIITESFKSLVRQLKKYHHKQRGKIANIFRYIKGAAVGISEKYKQVQSIMSDSDDEIYSNNPTSNGISTLPSREMTPTWLREKNYVDAPEVINKEESIDVPEAIKENFLNELSSHIEYKYKNYLSEDLYKDLQNQWLKNEWYWSRKDIEALLEDKDAFLEEQMQFAENRMQLKKKLMGDD